MKKVFEASYKSFYYGIIGFLWALAIMFALLQSGIAVEFALKKILPKFGVEAKSVSGGILSGIELRDVKYEKLFSASEIRFRPNLGDILLDGELSLSSLDLKDLRLNEAELKKIIDKSSSKKPDFLKTIKIENISASLIESGYGDIKIQRLKLNSDYLYYDFEKFYMDLKADLSSNILDAKFSGDILDKNYSFRGMLKSNGSQYINKIVGDVDFDFNGLKETDFLVRGDDEALYAKAHIKNSGLIYKYGVDAKANDVISEVHINFKNPHLKVTSSGELECRYAIIDSKFDVVYDGNKTVYYGKAKAKRFKYIPLGAFEKSLKIKEATNEEITFKGDVHKLEVTAKNRITATLLGDRFDVVSSDTVVSYDIDNSSYKVLTKAKLKTDYFAADVDNTVEDNGKFAFFGKVSNFEGLSLGIECGQLAKAQATYRGNNDSMYVDVKSEAANIKVTTNGYSKYDFSAALNNIKPDKNQKFSYLGSSKLNAKVNGYYDHQKKEIVASIHPIESLLFGKPLETGEISFKKTPHELFVAHTKIKLGGVDAEIEARTVNSKFNGIFKTGGVTIKADGVINKELILDTQGNMATLAEEWAKITGTKKQNISGLFAMRANLIGNLNSPEFQLSASSDMLTIGGEKIQNINIALHSQNDKTTIQKLSATYQNQPYYLSKPAIIHTSNGKAVCDEFRINDTLLAKFEYQNSRVDAQAKLKNFAYKDNHKLSFILNADVKATYEKEKLEITGDASLRDLRAGFELKSSKITKDKDIVVLSPKKLEFNEQKFIDNLALHINISNENRAYYKSKEAYAPLDMNLVYYKDYGRKPVMLGLIKTSSGYYDFEGKRFFLLPSQIALTENAENDPYLDLTLRHVDKEAEIFIYVREFASAPKISFSSKPAMSEKEIISYLLFGVDPDSGFTRTSSDARYSSKAIATLSNALSRDLTKEFGIKLDKVEISPTEVTDKTGRTTQTTKVEVGKRVTKDLTVTYKNDIESSVVFEYQINKNVNVESQAGRKSSIDIFYKKDY
ncbi:MAG: translocation/assembly module TamB domain-containing protein [Campylobacteraceae bacterium]|nr:translocation/assembly module TamB domain-containing protein [Campylobacteraceae bacterium]